MLMTVVFMWPAFGPLLGVATPLGFRKSCTKPTICTGVGGGQVLLSNTGTVTSESLTSTSFPTAPATGLLSPARNWKGGLGAAAAVRSTSSASPGWFVAWVRQLTARDVSVSRFV